MNGLNYIAPQAQKHEKTNNITLSCYLFIDIAVFLQYAKADRQGSTTGYFSDC
jgi:hypothetical protein